MFVCSYVNASGREGDERELSAPTQVYVPSADVGLDNFCEIRSIRCIWEPVHNVLWSRNAVPAHGDTGCLSLECSPGY